MSGRTARDIKPFALEATGSRANDPVRNDGPAADYASATELISLLRHAFGFSAFRPNQEAVCRAAIEGKDVLLVMPTGSGKSLCYQLSGIARGGTTLVVSPLIALMEDQVAKLKEHGFAVERIHSGRPRAVITSTEGCDFCLLRLSGCACPASQRCWPNGPCL